MGNSIRLLGGLLLLLANAFFVATEFGLTRLRQYDREELRGISGLERVWKMTRRLEIFLTSCQIGITTTSILHGVIAEPAVTHLIERLFMTYSPGVTSENTVFIALSIVLINVAHTIWGEQTPTYFGG